MSIPTEAATLPSPPEGDQDVVGTTTKKEQLATFKGKVTDGEYYPGVVVGMKSVTSPNKFKPGEMREQCVWLLAIEGREDEGELAWYTSFSLHEKSKLPGTLAAFDKPAPQPGEPLRKSVYLGAKCRMLLEYAEGKAFPSITKLKKR